MKRVHNIRNPMIVVVLNFQADAVAGKTFLHVAPLMLVAYPAMYSSVTEEEGGRQLHVEERERERDVVAIHQN